MLKKLTHEEYIEKLKNVNPNIEVVGEYINGKTSILFHCCIHDVYWKAQPFNLLNGSGCMKCGIEKTSKSKNKNADDYIKLLKEKNINYIIPIEEYKKSKTPILHKCLRHNVVWETTPDNVLSGHGCIECGKEKSSEERLKKNERYKEELNDKKINIISIEEYKGSHVPILHRCLKDNHEWKARPANVLNGKGCPICSKSKGEIEIANILDENNIRYEREKRFKDCRDKKPLPFDFYLPDYNICIEYDGMQHYKPIKYFGGEKQFLYRINHDDIKTKYCEDNNIILIRISYKDNINEKLNTFLLN